MLQIRMFFPKEPFVKRLSADHLILGKHTKMWLRKEIPPIGNMDIYMISILFDKINVNLYIKVWSLIFIFYNFSCCFQILII